MNSNFLPVLDKALAMELFESGRFDEFYEYLVQPLHEELYRRQHFEFIEELSPGQQLLLAYDYLRTQVLQGGFIQFIQNGYVLLLPDIIEQLLIVKANNMAKVIDDVLKVYVLNRESLDKETSVEEFAKLYEEFKEFEILDQRFIELNVVTERIMIEYAYKNLSSFLTDQSVN